MLAWMVLLAPALAAEICAQCEFTTLRQAFLSVAEGQSAAFEIAAGNYAETSPLVLGPNRSIRLEGLGAVTLTNNGTGAVIVVDGANAQLSLRNLTLTAFNDRILDLQEGQAEALDSVLYTLGVVQEGGAVFVGPGAAFLATDTLFLDSFATSAGGHVLVRDGAVMLSGCRFMGGYARRGGSLAFEGITAPVMATIQNSVFEQNLAAETGGAIALAGDVALHIVASQFEGNIAERGGALADHPNLSPFLPRIHISDSSFEDNTADDLGGALYSIEGVYTVTDTVFASNTALEGGALYIEGGVVEMDRGLLCENIAQVRGGAVTTLTDQEQRWYNNRMIENTAAQGGAIYHSGRGLLELYHANLLGNSALVGGAVRSEQDVLIRNSLVGWTEGGTALVAETVLENWNAMWQNVAGDVQESTPDIKLEDHDLRTDPRLERYLPGSGCDAADDFYNWYGPLRGHADSFAARNPDGSIADIGAFGGARASMDLWADLDGDGFPALYDCVEGDSNFHPEATDIPYDGADNNCDRKDDFDSDGDGSRYPDDCNDLDDSIYPGAIELPGRGDQNCDGREDADGDGYSPPDDCNDGDDRIHPGATEDPGPEDLDCKAPADVPRPLEPRTCSTTARPDIASAGLALLLGLLALRRQRR